MYKFIKQDTRPTSVSLQLFAQEIESGNNYLGYNVSNNQAEYQGLTDGLDYIVNNEISCHELLVRGDAEIVIRQMTGRYQVRSHNIIPYYNEAQASLAQVHCNEYGFYHISRDGNGEADQLANEAIDGEGYY